MDNITYIRTGNIYLTQDGTNNATELMRKRDATRDATKHGRASVIARSDAGQVCACKKSLSIKGGSAYSTK